MNDEVSAGDRHRPPEREHMHVPCCPELKDDEARDALDFHYRLLYPVEVDHQKKPVRVYVEVVIRARLERWTDGLGLGDLVYSTTLFPGERVRLFTQDRRSRFTWDAESNVSYRHEQTAEERYYMSAMAQSMSDLEIRDQGRSTYQGSSDFETQGDTSGALQTLIGGASVEVEGEFNSSATSEFVRELSQHAESSHHQSVEAVRTASSVSVGEVQRRSHVESESESHYESSSRTFANDNRCRAVTYFFYQINKIQKMRFRIVAVRRRIVDPAAETKVTTKPALSAGRVAVMPELVKATSAQRLEVEERARESVKQTLQNRVTAAANTFGNMAVSRLHMTSHQNLEPLPASLRDRALQKADGQLRKVGVLGEREDDPGRTVIELGFETTSSLPTPGLLVRGCLDDCHVCEPSRARGIELDLERKELENQVLLRQIELMDKAQEYRCCPQGAAEEGEDEG